MGRHRVDLTGQQFGRWTVLYLSHTKNQASYWLCRCDCGVEKPIRIGDLRNGKSQSCGCLRRETAAQIGKKSLIHGHSSKPTTTYCAWNNMISLCYNPNIAGYNKIGGRGIKVCNRWRSSFAMFLADMGEKPVKHTLKRRWSAGNFEPGNCYWAPRKRVLGE